MTDTPKTDALASCPFCGSDNVKSGGDDKIVGVWCLNCEASGPNGYLTTNGEFDWNTRAAPTVKPLGMILNELVRTDVSHETFSADITGAEIKTLSDAILSSLDGVTG